MSGEKPAKPASLETPGLIYRRRQSGWVLSWSPRSDLVERGFRLKADANRQNRQIKLWPPSNTIPSPHEPTADEWETISAWCRRYQAEMLAWANGGDKDDPRSVFDGTIGSLIKIYQVHKRSPFGKLRYKTHLHYTSCLRSLDLAVGKERVISLTFEDILDWQDQFSADDMHSRAGSLLGHLKRIIRFGALVLPRSAGCHDACDMFVKMRGMLESGIRKRTEYITAEQCIAFRIEANRRGRRSVALVQAIAFESGMRPKDVYGEWIPVSWPGTSDIIRGEYKWLMGGRWDEIDAHLIWRHRLSKSVRGKNAVARNEGKLEEFDLKSYPMIMEELPTLRGAGPLIINEHTGYPWNEKQFQKVWRDIARAVGIPENVQNRDSRAGAATEAELAGANPKIVQRMLGHSRTATTERYIRGGREIRNAISQLRQEGRRRK